MDGTSTIRISHHARERMRQRNISREELEQGLLTYHTSYTDRDGNPIYIAHVGGRRIKIVIRKDSRPPFVVTVAD